MDELDIKIKVGKKVSCNLPDLIGSKCDFCDGETKICIAKLHGGHCKFKKVGLGR